MTPKTKFSSICSTLAIAAGLVASTASSHAQASATMSDTAVSGGFDYTITLDNTTGAAIQSFWYGWTTAGNNLPGTVTVLGSPTGWSGVAFGGNSVQWTTTTTPLANGATDTYSFFSATTPAAITTLPSGQSVTYTGGINFATDGQGIFSPVLTASPEPSSIALLAVGSLGLLGAGWRKFRGQN